MLLITGPCFCDDRRLVWITPVWLAVLYVKDWRGVETVFSIALYYRSPATKCTGYGVRAGRVGDAREARGGVRSGAWRVSDAERGVKRL